MAIGTCRDTQRKALEDLQHSSDPVALLETVRRCQASLASLCAGQDGGRQLEDNRKYWEERLQTIDSDLEREPERIRHTFALQTHRVEPAGAIYLWPQGEKPQEVA